MTIYQQVVAACWAVLVVVWFVLALVLGQRGRHSTRVWWLRLAAIAVLLLAVYFITRARPPPALAQPTERVALAGALLCIAGLAFAVWARLTMGRHWQVPPTQRDRRELVTAGPFKYARHPIYAGVIAMLIGSAVNIPGAWVEALTAILSLVILARHEERDMLRLLPDVYPAYMQRTKRFLPFVF
jgi:protein-S-isoprenylcysteine O-methyltransferase Ste14